jgi:putative ATPase
MLSEASGLPYAHLSAVRDGVRDIRQAVEAHRGQLVFVDEIHRLTRSQQDVLLPILEHDECWVLGATTESPMAVFQPAILSRVRLVRVQPPGARDTAHAVSQGLAWLQGAIQDPSRESRGDGPLLEQAWSEHGSEILRLAAGDVRLAWNLLDSVASALGANDWADPEDRRRAVQEVFDNVRQAYTRGRHYDFASAMIKAMRGSDPDAALYYAMAALDGGEDVLFLLRRCMIFASEDVGNADPQALLVATQAHYAAAHVGLPEARIPLAQAVTYLAATVKSNRSYVAIATVRAWREQAEQQMQETKGNSLAPPAALVLKGASDYVYPHDQPGAFVATEYLPEAISRIRRIKGPAYQPSDRGFEARLGDRLKRLWSEVELPSDNSAR